MLFTLNATLQQITDKFHSIDFPEVDVRNFTIISDKTLPHLAQSSQIYEDYDKQCQFEDDAEGVRAIFDNAGYMTYLAYLKNVSVSASYSISCVGYYYDDQGHRHIPSQKCDEISTYATPLFLQHGFADDSCYPSNLNITEQCPDQCINNDTITLKPNNNTDLGAFIALNKSAIEAKILMLRYGTFIMTYQYSPYDFFDFTKKFDKDSSVLYAKNNNRKEKH
ncbi:MAG: hypothetical protein EZS28_036542 [Streblomastix strix]|uniref:Uncharacterized protein n=1 Tax=Streblomastix strix TaxID=222440 RepID=A0A5J4UDH6_9EUKA|nr:MAG: hypothetical protein EZS28_036542 [Streblomastix strix]